MGDTFDYLEADYRIPRPVTCKFCGRRGFKWHPSQQQTLVDARGAIHDCRGPADPDEFETVED